MNDVPGYISAVNRCCSQQNGQVLSHLLALPVGRREITPEMRSLAGRVNAGSVKQCESRVSFGLGGLVASRLSTLAAIIGHNWAEANRHSISMYNSMLNAFREEGASWLIPVICGLSDDVRLLATEVVMLISLGSVMIFD